MVSAPGYLPPADYLLTNKVAFTSITGNIIHISNWGPDIHIYECPALCDNVK